MTLNTQAARGVVGFRKFSSVVLHANKINKSDQIGHLLVSKLFVEKV